MIKVFDNIISKKEQEEIVDKIVNILDLQNKTEYTLYELDKNEEVQKNNGTDPRNKKVL